MRAIEELRKDIEARWIGFSPSTTAVKPVHIANGMFRALHGGTYPGHLLNRFVFTILAKDGKPPSGHDIKDVYPFLVSDGRIEETQVSSKNLQAFRIKLDLVVAADGAVFNKGMWSYTGGSYRFLSRDHIGQDGGEFVAAYLVGVESRLSDVIRQVLEDRTDIDVITALALPLLDADSDKHERGIDEGALDIIAKLDDVHTNLKSEVDNMWFGLREASDTLAVHLSTHPNKLFRLRLSVRFACFVIIRHLANLEAYYADQDTPPPVLLLDFSDSANNSIAQASMQTYLRMCRGLARFYTWAFAQLLEKDIGDPLELVDSDPPLYKGKSGIGKERANSQYREAQESWRAAVSTFASEGGDFSPFGEALYDMLSTQASADPVKYLRTLGLRAGFLYPPNQNTPRFNLSQDTLEMLVRGAVAVGETVDMLELQKRFLNRYGFVIGEVGEAKLRSMNVSVDQDDLRENSECFGRALSQLNFAQTLADGVLRVEL